MNNEMDLFKQAIREALDKKIDEAINSENETLDVSKKHKIAMRTILRGKIPTEGRVSPKTVRIIAIVAIIALLLASCAIIYREEIGKLRVKILERYAAFAFKLICGHFERKYTNRDFFFYGNILCNI